MSLGIGKDCTADGARFDAASSVRACVQTRRVGLSMPERRAGQPALTKRLSKSIVSVLRRCADDLVMGWDEGWVARWRPPGS